MVKPGFLKKIFLLFFGVIVFLILLEAVLRVSGGLLSFFRERRNIKALQAKADYSVLCVGESTTAGQYPVFLQEELDRRGKGAKFRVIDKGLPGTVTAAILNSIESYLDAYRPDIVVAMMGINDSGVHLPRAARASSRFDAFLRSLKAYKLSEYIWFHMRARWGGHNAVFLDILAGRQALASDDYASLCEKGWVYCAKEEFKAAEAEFLKAIGTDPVNSVAYLGLGQIYRQTGDCERSEAAFRKVIELDRFNTDAYVFLGELYQVQGKWAMAQEIFNEVLARDPDNADAYIGIGVSCQLLGELERSRDMFVKAVELAPDNAKAHMALGEAYLTLNEIPLAEAAFLRTIEMDPGNGRAYMALGWIYRNSGRVRSAEKIFKKAIELSSQRDNAYAALVSLYDTSGQSRLMKLYDRKIRSLRDGVYLPSTLENYRKLKKILDQRGIVLVCVQYPMRSLSQLRMIFEGKDNVFFVDNENSFKKLVARAGINEVFTDLFAGDFGHCTEKGNRLLSANIADVIIGRVLRR